MAVIYSGIKEKSSLERIRKEIKNVQLLNYEFSNTTLFEHLKKIVKDADKGVLSLIEKNKSGSTNDLLVDKSANAYMIVYIALLLGIIRVKR